MLNVEGKFKALVLAHGTDENPTTGSVQFKYTVQVIEQWVDGAWVQVQSDEITDGQNIIKKDGSLNETGIKCIQEAMGWTQANFNALNDDSFVNKTVQIVTAFEQYEGKDRLKIKYLSNENFEGFGARPMDAAKVQDLQNRFGSKLRSVPGFGGAAVKRGTDLKPPAAKPAPVVNLAPPVEMVIPDEQLPDMGPPDEAPPPVTKDDAWKAVYTRCGNDRAKATAEWKKLVDKYKDDYAAIIEYDGIPF